MPVRLCQATDDQRLGPIVEEYYAATEGGGNTSRRRSGSHGLAPSARQCRREVVVRDPDGKDVPAGTVGMVWLRRSKDEPFEYHRDRKDGEHPRR
jgi:long-chain acyl-CoA synthetase